MNSNIYGQLGLIKEVSKVLNKNFRTVRVGPPNFREGTELPVIKRAHVLQGAGMGDYICYLPALLHIAKNQPWIEGTVFCPRYFVEFATHFFKKYEYWKVFPVEEMNDHIDKSMLLCGPGLKIPTRIGKKETIENYNQLLNGRGGHLVRVGHAYFNNRMEPRLEAEIYPQINFSEIDEPVSMIPENNPYIVICTGAVSDSRAVPGEYLNHVIDYVISREFVPIFLGKTEMSTDFTVDFPDDCDYHRGVDLRNKTSMMQAAWIMKNAAMTIGIDNGLLHLAACTDAQVIAGYNSVHPSQRVPHRPNGRFFVVTITKQDLACAHCQTNMENISHNFKYCLYKKRENDRDVQDLKCIDILFENKAERWKRAIDLALEKNTLYAPAQILYT